MTDETLIHAKINNKFIESQGENDELKLDNILDHKVWKNYVNKQNIKAFSVISPRSRQKFIIKQSQKLMPNHW